MAAPQPIIPRCDARFLIHKCPRIGSSDLGFQWLVRSARLGWGPPTPNLIALNWLHEL